MTEWIIAFAGGFIAGYLYDRILYRIRHQTWERPTMMSTVTKALKPHPNWYAKHAPTLMLGIIFVVVTSFIITIYGLAQDREQDRAFTENNFDILTCVGDWADDFTGASQPVRDASVERDKAVLALRTAQVAETTATNAVTELFIELVTNPNEDPTPAERDRQRARFLRIFKAQAEAEAGVKKAYDDYVVEEENLAAIRAANPLPKSPEIRCAKYLDR